MPLIQNPNITRKLQRALRLTELPDGILAPEIVGVILVEDVSAPLSDIERGCLGATNLQADVGEFPLIALIKVGDPSPYDAVVKQVQVTCVNNQRVQLCRPLVPLTGLNVSPDTSFEDFNLPGRPTSQLNTSTVAAIPTRVVLYDIDLIANTTLFIDLEIRLGPVDGAGSTGIFIVGFNAAGILRGGFKWTEGQAQG